MKEIILTTNFKRHFFCAVFCVVFVFVVVGCTNASVSDRCTISELQSFFTFNDYKSAEEAESALKLRFPDGSNANDLLSYLDKEFNYKKFKTEAWSYPSKKKVDFYAYQKLMPAGNNNKNLWLILLFVDLEDRIEKSEVRLTYMDEDFLLRGIPFRFENNYKEWMKEALFDLLGDDPSIEHIDKIMTDAGAIKNKDYVMGNVRGITYFYENYYPRIWAEAYGEERRLVLAWEFNKDNRLIALSVSGKIYEYPTFK